MTEHRECQCDECLVAGAFAVCEICGDRHKTSTVYCQRCWDAGLYPIGKAALAPVGKWTSVLPNAPGYYWYRIPAPDEDSLEPDTWTDVRLRFWNRPALIGTLGCSIQFWSVPVEPPPLPEVADGK